MLRHNHSEGSSTSRSLAKTALLPALRKTFQFSNEQCPWYIFFTEPLFLIPSVQTEIQVPPVGAILFSKEPVFLMPARPSPFALEAAREIGFARLDRRTIFEGTTFPRSFRLRSVAQHRQQIGSPRITARFFEGTTFPPSSRPRLARQEARTLG